MKQNGIKARAAVAVVTSVALAVCPAAPLLAQQATPPASNKPAGPPNPAPAAKSVANRSMCPFAVLAVPVRGLAAEPRPFFLGSPRTTGLLIFP